MATTFTGTATSGVTLSDTGENAATLASGALIESSPDSFGVYGARQTPHYAWTFVNYGQVTGIGTGSTGVLLEQGGLVTNGYLGGSATISGGRQGISIALYQGTVSNFGLV